MKRFLTIFSVLCVSLAMSLGIAFLSAGGVSKISPVNADIIEPAPGSPEIRLATNMPEAGELLVNDTDFGFDTEYSAASGTEVIFTAVPNAHFKFTGFTVRYDESGSGDFIDIDLSSDGSVEYDEAGNPLEFTLTLGANDYEVEVSFAAAVYELDFNAVYFNGGTEPVDEYFVIVDENGEETVVSDISIGDTLRFKNTLDDTLEDINTAKRFAYAEIVNANSSTAKKLTSAEIYEIVFDSVMLDAYVTPKNDAAYSGTVTINGVYIETPKVTVSSSIDLPDNSNSIIILAFSPISLQGSSFVQTYKGENEFRVDKGTELNIDAFNDRYMSFDDFTFDQEKNPNTADERTRYVTSVTSDFDVTLNFNLNTYDITFRGMNGTLDVPLGETVSAEVDGITSTGFVINSANPHKLTDIKLGSLEGYVFDGFEIRTRTLAYEPLDKDGAEDVYKIIDDEFFDKYVYQGKIEILVKYVKMFELNVNVSLTSSDLGSVKIYRVTEGQSDEELDLSENRYFEYGTKFKIAPVYNADARVFSGFIGVSTAETNTDGSAAIELTYNRNITAAFGVKSFIFEETANGKITSVGAETVDDKTTVSVGKKLIFTYEVPANHDIKEWKINGININSLGGDASLVGNSLHLTLSEALIKAHGTAFIDSGKFIIDNSVTTSLKTGVVVGITIPSVVLPILIILLLVTMLINAKRKKLIRAQLEGKWTEMKTKDVGGYISALREGKDGTVSKEDIKQAMKEQKEQKKAAKSTAEKPADAPAPKAVVSAPAPKAAPAPKPAAAAPSVVASVNLVGAKIMQDRTLTSGGAVIATLETDGTIKDKTGRAIAAARMEDGAVLDMKNNVIGKIKGDGTIAKP